MNQLALYTMIGIALAAVACKTLQTKVGPRAAQAINAYCLEPLATRQALRTEVNSLIAPNQVKIVCEGDPE